MGQRVWTHGAQSYRPFGTAAQYTVVPDHQAVPLPDHVGDELGASLGIPGITAHRAVFGDGPVAAALAETKPERGAQTLRIISASGRDALAELRRLLAVISDDDGDKDRADDAPLAPQPGLSDLDSLLDRVRAAGPTVDLDAQGDLTGLPPGLQLSVYRIVQEALTNTVKYAVSDTSVRVSVAAAPDAVRVTVEDPGPARAPATGRRRAGSGRGLVGMRERAALYQGTVTAGPNDQGGWTVHALLIPTPTSNSPEKHHS
ncbi:ATP-binding protein [Streptomyces sp. R35]|uniref:histidine kinase n=1 Tax=Streptomyces sp. R35 TaxID=3238630 RepID=A0AB39RX48_9ACTN